jgi:glycolate oxidase
MPLPFSEISAIVGNSHLLKEPEELYCYSFDASKMKSMPQCVVFPGDVSEVSGLLKLANRRRFPVFPRGAGSGMVGACIPDGGMVMVLTRRTT